MSELKFLNIFLSLTHQHNKKKKSLVQQQGFKKTSSALIQNFRFLFLPFFFEIIFLSLLFYRIL